MRGRPDSLKEECAWCHRRIHLFGGAFGHRNKAGLMFSHTTTGKRDGPPCSGSMVDIKEHEARRVAAIT